MDEMTESFHSCISASFRNLVLKFSEILELHSTKFSIELVERNRRNEDSTRNETF